MSDWYYAVNNEQKGPINESELKANFATNTLPMDTLVWKEGMDNWTAANQVPSFSFRQPPTPAKVQPGTGKIPAVLETGAKNPSSTTPVDMASLVGPGESLEVDYDDAEKNKVFGILSYLSILWLVPMMAAKDSPFAKYHANQGLVLFLVEFALWIVLGIIDHVLNMLNLSYVSVFLGLAWLGVLVLIVMGIINAAQGKCVPLWLIGRIKLIK